MASNRVEEDGAQEFRGRGGVYGRRDSREMRKLSSDMHTGPSPSIATVDSTKANLKHGISADRLESTIKAKQCTLPRGLLAIHLKRITLSDLDMYRLFKKYNATMYLRISCQNQVKCTTAYHNVTCPKTVLLDEMKHFRLKVANKRGDSSNYLHIELVACPSTVGDRIHRILCSKDVHLFDIIKNLFISDTYAMRSGDRPIAEVEVEMAFAYGVFGYGYSSQFFNKQRTTQEHVSYSMFCFAEPPEGREDYTTDVMVCKHIGHPSFINFAKKVDIGLSSLADDLACYPELQQTKKPQMLAMKIRKGLKEMQREYGAQKSRCERIEYLRRKIAQPGRFVDIDNIRFEAKRDYKLRYSNLLQSNENRSSLSIQVSNVVMGGVAPIKQIIKDIPVLKKKDQMGTVARIASTVVGWFGMNKTSKKAETGRGVLKPPDRLHVTQPPNEDKED